MGVVAGGVGEGFKFFALFGGHFLRHVDFDVHQLVAAATGAQVRHALFAETEGGAAGGAGGNFQRSATIERRHLDAAAERGQGELDRHGAVQIVAVSLEKFVLLDVDDDVKVAVLAALGAGGTVAGGAEFDAGFDAWRNFDRDRVLLDHPALAAAFFAGLFDDGARAAAGGARLADGEKSVGLDSLAGAATGRAFFAAGTRFGAGAVAIVADDVAAVFDLFFRALGGFL